MAKALAKELELRTPEWKDHTVSTIYFGGGTPSLMPIEELNHLLEVIRQRYQLADSLEITLETNPDDHTPELLNDWKAMGINRLSVGIQSFNNYSLEMMNRAHNATQAIECVHQAKEAGFDNISIDLIYGAPFADHTVWASDLEQAKALDVPHISAYSLTIEPNTAFGRWVDNGRMKSPDEEHAYHQMRMLYEWMPSNGYDIYEISNFAKPGFESKHNSSYWQNKPYLGIGPAAHSYDGEYLRRWNKKNNPVYIKALLLEDYIPHDREMLSKVQKANEMIMTQLRTRDGISLNQLIVDGFDLVNSKVRELTFFRDEGLLEITTTHVKLTPQGRFVADALAEKLWLGIS